MLDQNKIAARLNAFAKDANDTAPSSALSDDGAPSPELMAYCDKHGLTLDWALLGASPTHRKPKAPRLADIELDAIFLHGLLQGLDILICEAESTSSPATNATHALGQEVIKKCEQLAGDLSSLVDATPGARQLKTEASQ